MPGNERDPLDDWLAREIQPLAPPSGTFELIRKRARRRKMGRLVATVGSAAAVAIVATVGVTAATTLHLGSSATGTQVANGRAESPASSPAATAPSPSATAATSAASPSSTPSATAGATSPAGPPAGGPVPPNFQPTSVTFVSTSHGWAIGQGGTAGHCANANPDICTSIAATTDGGQSWQGVPAPSTNQVSGIRFLNGADGWAYGPGLWSTSDGGQTWQQDPTGNMVVTALETEGGRAFAVFANCTSAGQAASLAYYGEHCTDFQLETTLAGPDSHWQTIAMHGTAGSSTTLPASGSSSQSVTDPAIVLQGDTGWLVGPLGQVYTGSLSAGTWNQVSVSPCAAMPATSPTTMLGWSLATGSLVAACDATQSPVLYTSADGGSTWTKVATAPSFGTATALTASPAEPSILATTDGIEADSASTGQWQQVTSLAGGFSYVGMTSQTQGVAIPADTSLHQIWMTYDGGQTWQSHTFP